MCSEPSRQARSFTAAAWHAISLHSGILLCYEFPRACAEMWPLKPGKHRHTMPYAGPGAMAHRASMT